MSSIDLYGNFDDEAEEEAGYFDGAEDQQTAGHEENDDEREGGDGDEVQEKVDPKIKVIRAKRKILTLNVERLKGPRGIIAVDDFFQNIKFKGRGYEKQDLDETMKRLEHWAHRMYPKYNFDDSLTAIERLGKKKEVAVYLARYRLDQLTKNDEERILSDDEDNNEHREGSQNEDAPMDEFEALIDEQIALSTAHSRPEKSFVTDKSFGDLSGISAMSTSAKDHMNDRIASSSQHNSSQPILSSTQQAPSTEFTDEIRARIAENKRKAMAILEQRKKEEEEKQKQKLLEDKLRTQEISNINIDDDDDF